jgi:hypothetical protein
MINSNPVLFWVIVGGVIFMIIAINVSLFSALRDRTMHHQIKITQRLANRISSPWQEEDDNLAELSKIVDTLNKPGKDEPPQSHPDQNT